MRIFKKKEKHISFKTFTSTMHQEQPALYKSDTVKQMYYLLWAELEKKKKKKKKKGKTNNTVLAKILVCLAKETSHSLTGRPSAICVQWVLTSTWTYKEYFLF